MFIFFVQLCMLINFDVVRARRQVDSVGEYAKTAKQVHHLVRTSDVIDLDTISNTRRTCKAQDDLNSKYYPPETHGEHAIRLVAPGLPTVGDLHAVVDKIQVTDLDLEVKILRKDNDIFTFSVTGSNGKAKGTIKAWYEGLDFKTPQSALGGFGKGFSKFEHVAANIFCFGQCTNYARVDQAKVDIGVSMSADFSAGAGGKWQLVQGTEKQEVDIDIGSGGIVMSVVNKIISGAGGIPKLFFDNVWPLLQQVIPSWAGRAFQKVPIEQAGVEHLLRLKGVCTKPDERKCPSQELHFDIVEEMNLRMRPEPIIRGIYDPAGEASRLIGTSLKSMLGDLIRRYNDGENAFHNWDTSFEVTADLTSFNGLTVSATPHIQVALAALDAMLAVDLPAFAPISGEATFMGAASIRKGVASIPAMGVNRLTLPVTAEEGLEVSAMIEGFTVEVESEEDEKAMDIRYLPMSKDGRVLIKAEANGEYLVLSPKGVSHRRSKNIDDRDEGWFVDAGELVPGSDDGDGWLKCTIPKKGLCAPGDVVHAVWGPRGKFYGATIRRIFGNGRFLVDWDDDNSKYRYVPSWQVTKGSKPCGEVADFIFNKDSPLEISAPGVQVAIERDADSFSLEPQGAQAVTASVGSPFIKSLLDGIGRRLQLPSNVRNGSAELADGLVPNEFQRPSAEMPALLDISRMLESVKGNIVAKVTSMVDKKGTDILEAHTEAKVNGVLLLDASMWKGLLRSKTPDMGFLHLIVPGLVDNKIAVARLSCGVLEAYYIEDDGWEDDPFAVFDLTKRQAFSSTSSVTKSSTRRSSVSCLPFGKKRFCGASADILKLVEASALQARRLADVATRWRSSCYSSLDGSEQVCPAKPDGSWLKRFEPYDRSTFFPGRPPPESEVHVASPMQLWTRAKLAAKAL